MTDETTKAIERARDRVQTASVRHKLGEDLSWWDVKLILNNIEELATLLESAQKKLERARTYSGYEGYACPLCTYREGKFIEACEMHKQIDTAQKRIAELEKQ